VSVRFANSTFETRGLTGDGFFRFLFVHQVPLSRLIGLMYSGAMPEQGVRNRAPLLRGSIVRLDLDHNASHNLSRS